MNTTTMYPGDYLNENSEAISLSSFRFESACIPTSIGIFHLKAIGFYWQCTQENSMKMVEQKFF